MTKEALDSIINNSEFTECINEAAPHRVKIIQDIGPQMREVQEDFLQTMITADYRGVAKIVERLKQDKKDEEAKEAYSMWKKSTMNLFRATLKTIHPNENQIPSISMLYTAGSLLTYIGKEDLITGNENYDKDNPLKFKKFEDMHPFLLMRMSVARCSRSSWMLMKYKGRCVLKQMQSRKTFFKSYQLQLDMTKISIRKA